MPDTKELSSDARKTAACAVSAGEPIRPSGIIAINLSLAASVILLAIGVSVGPGLRLFTRIRRCRRSEVQLRANDLTAAFDAL